jgi:hypothetical protein
MGGDRVMGYQLSVISYKMEEALNLKPEILNEEEDGRG